MPSFRAGGCSTALATQSSTEIAVGGEMNSKQILVCFCAPPKRPTRNKTLIAQNEIACCHHDKIHPLHWLAATHHRPGMRVS
eukprot:857692-Amphidinium_carterae.1